MDIILDLVLTGGFGYPSNLFARIAFFNGLKNIQREVLLLVIAYGIEYIPQCIIIDPHLNFILIKCNIKMVRVFDPLDMGGPREKRMERF